MPPSPRELEKLIVDARARIVWGDSPDSVRAMLLEQKIPYYQAEDILRDLLRERSASMRARGIVDLVVAAAVGAGAATLGFLATFYEKEMRIPARALAVVWAVVILLGCYAAKRLVDGCDRLLRGARAEGSDTDVNDV